MSGFGGGIGLLGSVVSRFLEFFLFLLALRLQSSDSSCIIAYVTSKQHTNEGEQEMRRKAHQLISKTGNNIIRFVVWSSKGDGMVNVYTPGDSGGEMMNLEQSRQYWRDMIKKHGYTQTNSVSVEMY